MIPSAAPLHEQVAGKIRHLITTGKLGPGDRLAPEDELAGEFGVSRATVRRALQELTNEGLLASSRGRGRVVRAYKPLMWHLSEFESRSRHEQDVIRGSAVDQWMTDVESQGRSARQDINVSIVVPPVVVAERLGIEDKHELVVLRSRTRYVDQTPYQLSDSYFRESLVRGTPLMEPRDVTAPGGLLASLGHPQAKYRDEIKVRMPSKMEQVQLELPAGTPVAEMIRTGYADDGTPLRVMITVAPGDRHVLIYEIDAA